MKIDRELLKIIVSNLLILQHNISVIFNNIIVKMCLAVYISIASLFAHIDEVLIEQLKQICEASLQKTFL